MAAASLIAKKIEVRKKVQYSICGKKLKIERPERTATNAMNKRKLCWRGDANDWANFPDEYEANTLVIPNVNKTHPRRDREGID